MTVTQRDVDQPITFSVVMPLYNKRNYVRAAVASVLSQRHDAFELIVVDDGSTDDSVSMLAGIDDQRLRVIRQANAGVASARNRGIAEAQHGWVALIDADDGWAINHLGELAAMIAARPDAGMVSTTTRLVRAGTAMPEIAGPSVSRFDEIDYLVAAVRDIHVVTSSSVALRRDALRSIGGFRDLRPGEDIDCWVRISLDWPVIHSDAVTAFYVRETGGAMDGWVTRRKGQKMRRIGSLVEFGGTVQTLSDALGTGRYEHRRRGAERYMDARILSNARKSLTWGDTAAAAERLRFVHRKTAPGYLAYRLLSLLPGAVIPAGIAAFRTARQLVRGR